MAGVGRRNWDTVYDVNLRYVARAVRQVLPIFLDQGEGGAIVSVGSVTGFMAAPLQAAYGVVKAGLLAWPEPWRPSTPRTGSG